MRRNTLIASLLILHAGTHLTSACAGSRTELERRLLDHLNDRMYGCCRAVVLTGGADGIYEGYVRFHNGRRNTLLVTVSDDGVEYALGPSATSTQPPPDRLVASQGERRDLQAVIDQQVAEIARLKRLLGLPESTAVAKPVPGPASDSTEPPPPAEPRDSSEPVTREMYDRIEKDMSRAGVFQALGTSGMLLSSSRFDGALNEIYVWTNADDSHVCVVFRDGRVLVKTQFGLDLPIR